MPAASRGEDSFVSEANSVASNLVVMAPQAQPAVDLCNAAMPPERRLRAPAHITIVYPFIPPALIDAAGPELRSFFSAQPPLRFALDVGWFGREVLLLRPNPEDALVALTRAVVARWPKYPYYGGAYDVIQPHVSLAFGHRDELEPLADEVSAIAPIEVEATKVSLLTGPHELMTVFDHYPLERHEGTEEAHP